MMVTERVLFHAVRKGWMAVVQGVVTCTQVQLGVEWIPCPHHRGQNEPGLQKLSETLAQHTQPSNTSGAVRATTNHCSYLLSHFHLGWNHCQWLPGEVTTTYGVQR